MSTETLNQPTQELIKVEEITNIMATASDVLAKNQSLLERCLAKGQMLIDTAASGMSDELDKEINDWQVKAKDALALMNSRRSPITQLMTKMAKVFTGMEAEIDPAKPTSYFSKAQELRNQWAKEKAAIQRQKEAEILAKQQKEKEVIAMRAEISKQIRDIYNTKLFSFKKFVSDKFNALTLENVDDIKTTINNVKVNYPVDKFNELVPTLFAVHLSKEELDALITEERDALYNELSANFTENMEVAKSDALDKIPSRINELKAIAKSSAAEKERLEKEAAERQQREDDQLAADLATQKAADEKRIEDQKKMEEAAAAFNKEAELAQLADTQSKVKESYGIEVSDAQGWGAIFLFWFEHEGKGLSSADIEKKTMKQLKAFAEKKASIKGGSLFIDNPYVQYIEDLKAVVTK
ncbi:hypothetical protein [Pedobacter zeae]|uniref:Uncharacterized protein n=1 Tax=Pedobacter zeae TaxID=1737356 RepID=A0A7W6K9J4_9SPHI|nr:hypothetical protein [Pedobacter zeae]MBB4107699.1 hypothetical protein [Pedobacter zeae]GGG97636.1 hypothetical protein GCM10007422_09530 [Pedobacter zeae]